MTLPKFRTRLGYLAALWAAGSAALAVVTLMAYGLGLNLSATGFAFLVVIVLLSLLDSLISSLIFSVIAVASLNFFFAEPRFSFAIGDAEDIWRLAAFFLTSLVITTLMRRLRTSAEMQGRQARLLDLSSDGIFACDAHDVIVYWSGGAEALYGWTRTEAIGRKPGDLLRTQYPVPLETIEATLERTGHWEGELTHTKKDGATVEVDSRWSLQRDEAGKPIGMLESNSDITERKRAEAALRQSQAAYLAEAQQLSATGSFGWSPAGGALYWSAETFRIYGYDPSITPTAELALARVHPDDLPRVMEAVRRAQAERQPIDIENRLLMPDGSIKTVHVKARPLSEAPDAQFVGAVMDVTARTEAYAALAASEQRYRHLFAFMPIALWQFDTSAVTALFKDIAASGVTDLGAHFDAHPGLVERIMSLVVTEEVNDATVKMFGASHQRDLFGPVVRYWGARPDAFRRAMESRFRGEPAFQEKTQMATFDGRLIDVIFASTRLQNGPTLVGIVDLTDQTRAQERLEQLQGEFAHAARISVLGELMASLAHEVNQPLAALSANGAAGLRWLDRPEPNVAEASALLRNIVADAGRAAAIIARIRSMASGGTPQRVPLSLHTVINEALMFLRHELQARQVSVAIDLMPMAPPVLGDRTQLQQVIVNLAINAAQAMAQADSPRRVLTVRTAPAAPDRLACSVEDSGPGIPPEHLDRLFESFFTTKAGGMGMGLAISRTIIETHGGTLQAGNGAAEGGARLSFTLPVAPAAP